MTINGKNIDIQKRKTKRGNIFFHLIVDGKCKLVTTTQKACLESIYYMGIEDQYKHQNF